MTAIIPLMAIMVFRMPVIMPGRALLVPLHPAASLTASAASELQTSFAACTAGVRVSRDIPKILMTDSMIILKIFDFM